MKAYIYLFCLFVLLLGCTCHTLLCTYFCIYPHKVVYLWISRIKFNRILHKFTKFNLNASSFPNPLPRLDALACTEIKGLHLKISKIKFLKIHTKFKNSLWMQVPYTTYFFKNNKTFHLFLNNSENVQCSPPLFFTWHFW